MIVLNNNTKGKSEFNGRQAGVNGMHTPCSCERKLAMIHKEEEKDQIVQRQDKPHLFSPFFDLFLSSHLLSIALTSFSLGLPLALCLLFIVGQKYILLQLELIK